WMSVAIQLFAPIGLWAGRGVIVRLLMVLAALAAVLALLGPRLSVAMSMLTARWSPGSTHTKGETGPRDATYSRLWRRVTFAIAVQAAAGAALLSVGQHSMWMRAGLLGLVSILAGLVIAFARVSLAQVELVCCGVTRIPQGILAHRRRIALRFGAFGVAVFGIAWIVVLDSTILGDRLLGASLLVQMLALGASIVIMVAAGRVRVLVGPDASVRELGLPRFFRGNELAVTPAHLAFLGGWGALIYGVSTDVYEERISAFISETFLVVTAAILIMGVYLSCAKVERVAMSATGAVDDADLS
ncbi:MAG: hypothetical protein ACRDT6_22065, partial [Micromonosporaceae bacterium]